MDAIISKLQSNNLFDREDGVDDLYKYWYEEARNFARGKQSDREKLIMASMCRVVIHQMIGSWSQPLLQSIHDDAVRCKMLEHSCKIMHVLASKEKFIPLNLVEYSHEKETETLTHYINHVALPLLNENLGNSSETVLAAILELIRSIVELEIVIGKQFDVKYDRLIQLVLQHENDVLVRDAGLKLLETALRTRNSRAIMVALVANSFDVEVLLFVFMNGGLSDSHVVKNILTRITARKSPLSVRALMREHLLNALHEYVKRRYQLVSVSESEKNGLRMILAPSDMVTGAGGEFLAVEGDMSNEWHSVLGALLNTDEAEEYVTLVLEHPSLETLSMVTGAVNSFSVAGWLKHLLPFVRGAMAGFNVDGVSGSAYDQEIINLLKESVRIFYRDPEARPSFDLGKEIFESIVEAMHHGYVQTERFPEAAAKIIVTHDNIELLESSLRGDITKGYKTARAVQELVNELVANESYVYRTLLVLSRTPTICSWQILNDLFYTKHGIFEPYPSLHGEVLNGVQQYIQNTLKSGVVDRRTLEIVSSLLCHMVKSIPLAFAERHFEIILQVAALDPSYSVKDETLRALLEKLPPTVSISNSALEDALRSSGEEVRILITKFAPHLCLRDISAEVRVAAVARLRERPGLLKDEMIVEQLFAVTTLTTLPVEQEYPRKQYISDIVDAAAPTLAALASINVKYLGPVLKELLRLRSKSKKYSDDGKVNLTLSMALKSVAERTRFNHLLDLASSSEGASLLATLRNVDENWDELVERAKKEGYMNKRGRSVEALSISMISSASVKKSIQKQIASNPSSFEENLSLLSEIAAYAQAHPEEFAGDREFGHGYLIETLLPRLRAVLPVPTVLNGYPVFAEETMRNSLALIDFMRRIQQLFPNEAAKFLSVDQRVYDLALVYVRHLVSMGRCEDAMAFLSRGGVRFPNLVQYVASIQRMEKEPQTPLIAEDLAHREEQEELTMEKGNPSVQSPQPIDYSEIENHAYTKIHKEEKRTLRRNEVIWEDIRKMALQSKKRTQSAAEKKEKVKEAQEGEEKKAIRKIEEKKEETEEGSSEEESSSEEDEQRDQELRKRERKRILA